MWSSIGSALQPCLKLGVKACSHAPKHPVVLPQPFPPEPATPLPELDAALKRLDSKKAVWASLGAEERAQLLQKCLHLAVEGSQALAADSAKAKGSYGSVIGEEW